MRNAIRAALIFAAALLFPALASAQCAFSSPVPSNTIVGRLGVGPGPCRAIPFSVLASQLQLSSNMVIGPPSSTVGDLAVWNNATGGLLKDGGGASITGNYNWTGNQYFGSGTPWVDVKSGANGCAAAAGNGTTDDTAAIQCQLNWINTNLGGGVVFLPHGNYLVSGGGLVVKGSTFLQGQTRFVTAITSNTDSTVITFDAATCKFGAGMADVGAYGWINASATQDTVIIGLNCPVTLSRLYAWGGHHALNTAGADGTYSDSFFCGWTGDNVFSTGANWYYSVKLDACSNPSVGSAFEQGASSLTTAENYFYRVDLSCGTCTNSIKINDGGGSQAITFFYGAITSKPIVISNARTTSFIGGELSTSITGAGLMNITGAYAGSSTTPSGGTYSCAGNTNIVCANPIQSGGTGATTAAGARTNLGLSAAGTSGQVQYNNSGAFGGFTLNGDCTLNTATGAITCLDTNGVPFTAGATNSTAAEQARLSFRIMTSCITGVNFNSANTDNAIAFVMPTGFARILPYLVSIQNASHTLVTATFGMFTATAGGGVAIKAAGTAITVSATTDATANNFQQVGIAGITTFNAANLSNTIYFRVGTAEGAAATADVCFDYFVRP
jgi:Pectate lyase superfamily protein